MAELTSDGYRIDQSLGVEWVILELLCQDAPVSDLKKWIEDAVHAGTVNWGELLDQALRHRMLPLLTSFLSSEDLLDLLPIRFAEHLRSSHNLNQYRRSMWYIEAYRVTSTIERLEIPVAVRKGAALESRLYLGNGSRWLGDLDLLILDDDADRVADLMTKMGYVQGLFNFDTGLIEKLDRAELIKYRLNPDHLPPYSLATRDPLVPVLEVDIATSLTWTRAPYQLPTADVLQEIYHQPIKGFEGMRLPCLTYLYQFLDSTLHLFREAWIDWWLAKEQDVDLMKFGDIIRLWRTHYEDLVSGNFRSLIAEYDLAKPVWWVLEHLDRTFGLQTVSDLHLEGVESEAYLTSAAPSGGSNRSWGGDMRTRLHSKDRRLLFSSLDEA